MALKIAPRPTVFLNRNDIPADNPVLLAAFDDAANGANRVDVSRLPMDVRQAAKALGKPEAPTGGLTNAKPTASAVAARMPRQPNPQTIAFREILEREVVAPPGSGMERAVALATRTVDLAFNQHINRGNATTIVLAGAYGSGKTTFAMAIARALGIPKDDRTGRAVWIDGGSVTVETFEAWLKGSAPGYVGYGEQSPLTEHTQFISVDDLDKRPPAEQARMLAALNGLMGDSPIQLGNGKTIRFKGILVVSGNYGADEAARLGLKGDAFSKHCRDATNAALPENITSRISSGGGIIGIEPADADTLKAIGFAKFSELINRTYHVLDKKRIDADLSVDPLITDALVECALTKGLGARPLVGITNLIGTPLFDDIAGRLIDDKQQLQRDDQRFVLQLRGTDGQSPTDSLNKFVDAIREYSLKADGSDGPPMLPPEYYDLKELPFDWVDQTSTARFAPASKPPFAVDGAVPVPLGSGTSDGVGYVVVNAGTDGSANQMYFVRKAADGDKYIEVKNFPAELKDAKALVPVQCCDIDDKRSLFVCYNFTGGDKQAAAFLLDGETGQFKAIKAPPVRQGAALGGNNGFAVLFSGRDPVFNAVTEEWSVPADAAPYDLNGQAHVDFAHVYDPNIDDWLAVPLPPRQVGRATESDARSFATPIARPDGTIGFAFGEQRYRASQRDVTLSRDSDWFTVIDPRARRVVHQGYMGFAAHRVTAFLGNDGRWWMAGGWNLTEGGAEMVPRTGIYSQNPRSGRWHKMDKELPGDAKQADMLAARHPDGIVMGPLDPSADAPNGFVVLQR